MATATPKVSGPSHYGLPVVEEVPPEIERAALGYISAASVFERAVAAHEAARDRLAEARASKQTAWTALGPKVLERDSDVAWDHRLASRDTLRDARIALEDAVEGPGAWYPVRGWAIGWAKPPGKSGFGGFELVILPPGAKGNPFDKGDLS